MRFGEEVRQLRHAMRLTAGELSARAGITPAAWSQIENGLRAPQLSSIVRIADAMAVPVCRLVHGRYKCGRQK